MVQIDPKLLKLLEEMKTKDSSFLKSYCYPGLSEEDKKKLSKEGFEIHCGKVRDCLIKKESFSMVHSDRLSAFDRFICHVPFKGLLLSKINLFWLEKAKKEGFPVAPFSEPKERVIEMENLKLFPMEVVVRGYLAGSMLRAYEKKERKFCQHTLPENLKPWGKLRENIVTPTSKAEVGGHDENTTPEELIKAGHCSKEEWNKIENLALSLYDFGRKHYKTLGWILVDTKYEFGKDKEGNIFIVDELHTPDSSRLWEQSSYEENIKEGKAPRMLDKEIIRRYLMKLDFQGEGTVPSIPQEKKIALAETYLEVARKLTA